MRGSFRWVEPELGPLERPLVDHQRVGRIRRSAVAGGHNAAVVDAVQDNHLANVAHLQSIVAGIPAVSDAVADHSAEGDALDRH